MKRLNSTNVLMLSCLLVSTITGCDHDADPSNAGNKLETGSDDTDCGPAEEALTAEEFDVVQWGGPDIYISVHRFQYFGECEFRCQHDFQSLIWRVDPEGNKTELFSLPRDSHILWDVTPDGSRLAVMDEQTQMMHVLDASGNEIASFDAQRYTDISLSPDGTAALLKSMGTVASDTSWTRMDLADNSLVEMTLSGAADARYVSWSPDGTRLAYFDNTRAELPLTVCNSDDTSPVVLGSIAPNDMVKIVWRSDSQAVYYVEYASADAVTDGLDGGWYELETLPDAAPTYITEAMGGILSSDGNRVLYRENSWMSVFDIAADQSAFSLSGGGGNCCR